MAYKYFLIKAETMIMIGYNKEQEQIRKDSFLVRPKVNK